MSNYIVYNKESLNEVLNKINQHAMVCNRFSVTITDKRSLDANSQVWVWIPKIAEFTGLTVPEVEAELKFTHGLPILQTDPEAGKKIEFILKRCGFYEMTREQQKNMVHFLPVTRLFSTKQHNAYRDSIQVYYASNGLILEYLG